MFLADFYKNASHMPVEKLMDAIRRKTADDARIKVNHAYRDYMLWNLRNGDIIKYNIIYNMERVFRK